MEIIRNPVMVIGEDVATIKSIEIVAQKCGIKIEEYKTMNEAFTTLAKSPYDIIILNYEAIGKSCKDFLKRVRNMNPNVFFILLVMDQSIEESIDKMREFNNESFFYKKHGFDNLLIQVERAYQRIEQNKKIALLNSELEVSGHELANIIKKSVDARDHYTKSHCDRVTAYCKLFGEYLSLGDSVMYNLLLGAMFHDIGKIGISDDILLKKGKLTEEEYGKIKLHPVLGEHILQGSEVFKDCLPIIRHHHERVDGKGYPDGLKSDDIPYEVKIISICDSFDAIVSERVYKPAVDPEKALKVLEKEKEKQFDGKLVDEFVKLYRCKIDKFIEIAANNK